MAVKSYAKPHSLIRIAEIRRMEVLLCGSVCGYDSAA